MTNYTVQRQLHDFYRTPQSFCNLAFELLPDDFHPFATLDAGAGDGAYGEAFKAYYNKPYQITGIELRDVEQPPYYDHFFTGNSFLHYTLRGYDLIVGNPPFKHSEMFARQALHLVRDGGYVVFLHNSKFAHSQARFN
jgi:hypothetical protein